MIKQMYLLFGLISNHDPPRMNALCQMKDGLEQLPVELRRGGARGAGVLGGGVPATLRALPRHRAIRGLGKDEEAGLDSLHDTGSLT